jgi:hypothetical protein
VVNFLEELIFGEQVRQFCGTGVFFKRLHGHSCASWM